MADFAPIPTSRFYVEFDGITEKPVKSVTPPQFGGQNAGAGEALASTKGGQTLRQNTSAGFEQNPNIKIEVYVTEGDMDFYNWMKAVMPTSAGGDGKWSENRKNGSVVGYDSEDTEVLRWNLTNAWPSSYKVSAFSADSRDLAVETLEIICEQINRET